MSFIIEGECTCKKCNHANINPEAINVTEDETAIKCQGCGKWSGWC